MPLDAEPHEEGNILLEVDPPHGTVVKVVEPGAGLYRSHFATCPHAAGHRR